MDRPRQESLGPERMHLHDDTENHHGHAQRTDRISEHSQLAGRFQRAGSERELGFSDTATALLRHRIRSPSVGVRAARVEDVPRCAAMVSHGVLERFETTAVEAELPEGVVVVRPGRCSFPLTRELDEQPLAAERSGEVCTHRKTARRPVPG